jgi:hypothetical protein
VISWQELGVVGVEIRRHLLNISRRQKPHEFLVHGVNDLGDSQARVQKYIVERYII